MSFGKSIELYLRAKINNSLTHKSFQQLITAPKDVFNASNTTKILILRQDRLGDVLVSTPFLKTIRETLPDAHIDILLGKNNIGIAEGISAYIDTVYNYKKNLKEDIKLLSALRKRKYNLVIDMFDNESTTSSIFIKIISAEHALGIKKGNAHVYSHLVPLLDKKKMHIVDRINQLMFPFNIDPSKGEYNLEIEIDKEGQYDIDAIVGKKNKI